MLAWLVASPCLLWLCVAIVAGAYRGLRGLDIRRRHRYAVAVVRNCAEQRALRDKQE